LSAPPDPGSVPRSPHGGPVGVQRPGNLHRQRAHASSPTTHHDLPPTTTLPLATNTLQGGLPRHRYGCRLLEREARRLRNEVLLFPAHILGKCAAANAEYRITGSKLRHVPTDRLDVPRHIDSRDGVLGSAQAGYQGDD